MRILVTGGAGFIGGEVVRKLLASEGTSVVNVDKLTYAGNLESLSSCKTHPLYYFEQVDICERDALAKVFERHRPSLVIHLAAESHVDRSIQNPENFVKTNILGTFNLLDIANQYWTRLKKEQTTRFRFIHVSTDEVLGDSKESCDSLPKTVPYFNPSSPYAASKASSDHLVLAWHKTYGFPAVVTRCSNNFGPFQFPEKFIPHMILNALFGKKLPIYGDGQHIRDWLYVEDHVQALLKIVKNGTIGETYNISGCNRLKNIDLAYKICGILEDLAPNKPIGVKHYRDLVSFVDDRLGHDRSYSLDAEKITKELGWRPSYSLDSGLRKTVDWYLNNRRWWQQTMSLGYGLERLGLHG